MTTEAIPKAFIWRRLHSLMGIWLSIYLIEHLLVNSQAALFVGDDGRGFINAVNSIHELPYLPIIEMALLGLPILIHMVWGIKYALKAKYNSFGDNGREPDLPEYPRNRAYTWQRITSWILVIGIIAHVIHMRFIESPLSVQKGAQNYYMVKVDLDEGLYTVASRIGVELYDQKLVQLQKEHLLSPGNKSTAPAETLHGFLYSLSNIFQKPKIEEKKEAPQELILDQKKREDRHWVAALEHYPLKEGQAIAVAKNFGTAELIMVRETFKMPIMLVLYTLFVLTACYHGFNGLWTFLIKWGVTLTLASQRLMLKISTAIMLIVGFLGLAAIWMTYWINLKQ